MVRTKPVERPGWAFSLAVGVLRPTVRALTSRTWHGAEKIPRSGGAVVVFNHISHFDPLVTGLFLYDNGHLPRYLVKEGLFRNWFLGYALRQGGQIPVARLTHDAVSAYQAAVDAVEAGQIVAVYPEGTLTRDPGLWPMRGKSGAARIALATGAPVIPVVQWGAQELLAPYAKRPRLLPRKHVDVLAGDPVELADLVAREHTPEVVQEATDRIMAALVGLLEQLRGEDAPQERYDPRRSGVAEIGNPNAPGASPDLPPAAPPHTQQTKDGHA